MSSWCDLFMLFLFKQKTAYEMRISDWSSDVCSSDLRTAHRITSPWKWRHLKSVIVPSVQSPPSMLKLHDFCNRADRSIPGGDLIGRWSLSFADIDFVNSKPALTRLGLAAQLKFFASL